MNFAISPAPSRIEIWTAPQGLPLTARQGDNEEERSGGIQNTGRMPRANKATQVADHAAPAGESREGNRAAAGIFLTT